jgi:3-methyladenine DNA glycosylase AlkD
LEIRERAYILACVEITSTGRIVTHRIRRQVKLAGLAKRSKFDDAGFLNLVALGVEFMSQRQSESKSLAADISQRIEALGNVAAQPIRSLRREISAALKQKPGEIVLDVALHLLKRQKFSHRFVAYELVHHHQDALARVNKRTLAQLGRGLESWADVDTFACYVSGPVWAQGQIDDDVIEAWAQSPDRWQRRAAVVSTVPLCRSDIKSSVNHERVLRIFDLVVDDRDPMVVKALSWGLRVLAKHAPRTAEEFLRMHGPRLAALVRREVNNKLTTGLKNPKKDVRAARRPSR